MSPAAAVPPPAAAAPPPAAVPPAPGTGGMPPTADSPWGVVPSQSAPPKRRGGLLAGVLAATLIAGGIGGGVGYLVADEDDSASTTLEADSGDGSETAARPPESVAGIAESALPSVVTIEAGESMEATSGTGFVYDEEGHILTNNHVVASAADGGPLTVTFSDGESYDAEVVGNAAGYDVAVIKLVDGSDRELDPLPMGDSDAIAVGDATIAIGAPFGLDGTVTTGIVSALDRPVASSDGTSADVSYMNAVQTDASINPGNSGGPLLNADGEVIGINSAIQPTSSTGQSGSVGLGFAIPINQAEQVAQDLMESGEPIYPIIGAVVNTDPMSEGGAIVEATDDGSEPVSPGGPADEAGLQPGDVITRFGDRVIDSGPTLISEIWSLQPGETVEVTYERGGEEMTTQITLGERVGDDA
jgi:putative serine protease PepD